LVLMCKILSYLVQCSEALEQRRAEEDLLLQDMAAEIPNRQETVAAVSAVIAEELGVEVGAIRILSFRRL
ncbi:MAG: hypothetical protein Q4B48_07305, partial [Syntrophomonadaceae bacterium]|nr:hypothetical protein [Syntrophomonadaceae bacterium]